MICLLYFFNTSKLCSKCIPEGVIIATNGVALNKTMTVRKLSFGVGVERIFPVHAPIVDSIEVIRKGKVRRSKLYYLRDRVGKAAKIKEDRS